MKLLAVFLAIVGAALILLAIATRSELQTVAISPSTPSRDSVRLLQLIGPELLEVPSEGPPVKPAELAGKIMTRIYLIGGLGLTLISSLSQSCSRHEGPPSNPLRE